VPKMMKMTHFGGQKWQNRRFFRGGNFRVRPGIVIEALKYVENSVKKHAKKCLP